MVLTRDPLRLAAANKPNRLMASVHCLTLVTCNAFDPLKDLQPAFAHSLKAKSFGGERNPAGTGSCHELNAMAQEYGRFRRKPISGVPRQGLIE
jgi:hypothetical protein